MRVAYFNANLRKGQDGVIRVMYKIFEGAIQSTGPANGGQGSAAGSRSYSS